MDCPLLASRRDVESKTTPCGDTMLSNNSASNVRGNLFVPSIKYVWARQGSHVGATAHQAELLQRPSDDDNCVWVKWATGEEE